MRSVEIGGALLFDLVKRISGIPFDTYLQKMKLQGFWCDAVFMHCLAACCKTDVMIYSADGHQTLVGAAIHGEEIEFVVPVVLSERYHWWAVVPAASDPAGSVQISHRQPLDLVPRLDVSAEKCFLAVPMLFQIWTFLRHLYKLQMTMKMQMLLCPPRWMLGFCHCRKKSNFVSACFIGTHGSCPMKALSLPCGLMS